MGLIPGLGRFPGEGPGNPLQQSFLENPMDRIAWQATVHRGHTESDTTKVTQHACSYGVCNMWYAFCKCGELRMVWCPSSLSRVLFNAGFFRVLFQEQCKALLEESCQGYGYSRVLSVDEWEARIRKPQSRLKEGGGPGPVIELSAPLGYFLSFLIFFLFSWFHESTPQTGRKGKVLFPRRDRSSYKNMGEGDPAVLSLGQTIARVSGSVLGSSFTIWSTARGS